MPTPRPKVGLQAWVAEPSLAESSVYALGRVVSQRHDASLGQVCEIHLADSAEGAAAQYGMLTVPTSACWPVCVLASQILDLFTRRRALGRTARSC